MKNLRKILFEDQYVKYGIILVLAFIIKVSYFNFSTGMPLDKIPYIFVTVCVFSFILIILYKSKKGYLAVNGLITILMFGDLLYYRYFNDFLSVKLVNQASYAQSVTDIMFSIIKVTDLILIIDLVTFIYISKTKGVIDLFTRKTSFVMTLFVLPTIILSISFASIHTGIKKYEFFNYHVYDIISLDIENNKLSTEENQKLLDTMRDTNKVSTSGAYFGVAKNKNVILIQIESLQNALINKSYNGQEITPNINKLIANDSIYFTNYYQQLGKGNTSDAEFVTLNSLYAITTGNTYNVYEKNGFYGLPWILREHGYSATSYHGYIASFWNRENVYPQIGFENSNFEENYIVGDEIGFGIDDHDFFKQSIPMIQSSGDMSFSFLVTLTSHKPFNLPEDKKRITLNEEDENLFGRYIQSVHYMDDAIGVFIEGLKEEGIYEDSVIIFYGDHNGIGMEDEHAVESMEKFIGQSYTHEDMMNIPLVIHIPNSGIDKTVTTTGGQIDFLPTLLNIMGINNKYLTLGKDLLNTESGFVASQTFMEKGSFIDDDKVFEISRDGDFEKSYAYARDTHESIDINQCRAGYERAIYEINLSKKITESDSLIGIINAFQSKKKQTSEE